ncbi:protein sel-1 homolog 3-like [Diadema setosum]|uniref:protein sel-1 homolog 3-like n=1 Tax=Diadema setosum TaxID=31175 RepID=UPI003B3A2030
MAKDGSKVITFSSVLLALNFMIGPVKLSQAKVIDIHNTKHTQRDPADSYKHLHHHHHHHQTAPPTHRVHQLPSPHHPIASQHETLSVVVGTDRRLQQRFIQVQSTPSIYPPDNLLQLEYDCVPGEVAGLEVHVWTTDNRRYRAFRHYWTCSSHSRHSRKVFQRLKLPDGIVYQPDFVNQEVSLATRAVISVWILPSNVFHSQKKGYYGFAKAKAQYNIKVLPPYSRPRKTHASFRCLTWYAEMMVKHSRVWNGILQCPYEKEVVDLMTFPMAFPSVHHGLSRDLPPFRQKGLRQRAEANINQPRFTFSAVLYVLEYCKHYLCGIFHCKTHYTNRYTTPLIFMNKEGKTFLQVEQENGQYSSMINSFKVPLKQWIQVVYTQDGRKWSLSFITQEKSETTMVGESSYQANVHYNETDALYHLGGSSAVASFSGYMVEAKLWRGRALDLEKVPSPQFLELNHTKGITDYYHQCDNLHLDMARVFAAFRLKHKDKKKRRSCQNTNPFLKFVSKHNLLRQPHCKLWQQPAPRNQSVLWKLLQHAAAVNDSYHSTHEFLSQQLYEHHWEILQKEGLGTVKEILPGIKQASCYGNPDATALLGCVYGSGLGVKMNQSQALVYWLVAAQGGSRLALLVLANKHHMGDDSHVPWDMDYAFRYFYHVAQETIMDRTRHDANDVTYEEVRLTDAEQLKLQTGETGDYFKWLKHQAKQGVADAQINLARMYYHGVAGVQRDIEAAAEFYRLNAIQNLDDPVAQYDYAVILLRGQGTEIDTKKGLEYLNRSAELGHGPAYTALGWYKLNMEHEDEAAARYFEQGDALGHRDAAHNLGFMYLVGRYPGKPIDRFKAFHYYLKAAQMDHWDSGLKVAEFYNHGCESLPRDIDLATAWARYIAEKNRDMAWALRRGLDAYLAQSWSESFVHYAMAAEAGLEVAQYNGAILCEENHDGVAQEFVDGDCAWRYWNQAVLGSQPHITSILKVADYHWYGYSNESDRETAIQYYIQGAKTREPQALFNLAYLLENGVTIPTHVWGSLGMSYKVLSSEDNVTKIAELYRMCRDGSADGFIPCGLALLRFQLKQVWLEHDASIKLASAVVVGFLTILACVSVFTNHLGTGADSSNSNNNNNSDNNSPSSPDISTTSDQSEEESREQQPATSDTTSENSEASPPGTGPVVMATTSPSETSSTSDT